MEINYATAKHVAWLSCAWLLLNSSPFPVGQTIYAHCTLFPLSTHHPSSEFPPLASHCIATFQSGLCSIIVVTDWQRRRAVNTFPTSINIKKPASRRRLLYNYSFLFMLVDGNEMLASSRIQPCLLALCNLPPYYNDMIYLSLQLSFHGANSASTGFK